MKKILVTGGLGFIGSHLCDRLIKLGNYVICLDNEFTGNIKNVQHLLKNPNFEFIRHDIIDPIKLEIDEIYHLACPASPKAYQYNSIKTIKTNIIGTLNMLGLAKRTKSKFLLTSTSEIYGDPNISPQHEEYWGNVNTIGIRSCYDEGKRLAETLTMEYNRNHNLQTKIVRIFNTYGPNLSSDDGRVISNFICQALKNNDITIYGDGTQTRSFCYINDLIEGLIKLMDSNYNLPVNIGNPNEITIKEIAELIVNMTLSKSKIIYLPLPKDDPTNRKPDINRAKEVLNWEPKIKLEEGLIKTINYFKKVN
jgi:UDP-glucuronate decarboxylase